MYIALIICIGLPFFILWLTYKSLILRKIGSIILAYILACLLSITGIVGDDAESHRVQMAVAQATVPLAIPLLLFSSDIKSWAKLAPSFIKSTICGFLACALSITVAFLILGKHNNQTFSAVGGMLTGLYTGGNANLASLKIALGVDDSTYLLVSAYSTVSSAIYLFFILTIGKNIARLTMPKFDTTQIINNNDIVLEKHDNELFMGLFKRDNLPDFLRGLILSILVIAIGAAIAYLAPKNMFQTIFILAITMISIAASFNKRVRKIKRTFELEIGRAHV